MMRLPQIGETWTHFKGGKYLIKGFAWEADGPHLVLRVIYCSEEAIFTRTLSNFLEPVDGTPRFQHDQT